MLNPGPGTYENSQNLAASGDENGSACFMAQERPKFDEKSVKNAYPGPGEYEATKRDNN